MSNRMKADAVIIGGGISGVSIAWHLARKGMKNIILLERNTLASGATGRCGAGIRTQWGAKLNCLLTKYSVEFFEKGNDLLEYNRDIEFKQSGYLIVAGTEAENEQFKKNVVLQNKLGIPSRYLSPAEAKDIIPIMDESKILGATFCALDGHLNPFHTTIAFAEAAKRLGVKIFKNTKATAIFQKNGAITGVDTRMGPIDTDIVVNAAGGWSKEVGHMAGIDIPVYSRRHQILVTEPLEHMMDPMYMGFSHNIYIQQVPHGSFLMGRGDLNEPTDLRMTSSWKFMEDMCKTCVELLPPLAGANVVRQWAGLYNMTQDAQPIYGPVEGLKGFYLAVGFSGHGFMLAPATGLLLSEMILGEELSLDVKGLDMGRFERGELVFESSVV